MLTGELSRREGVGGVGPVQTVRAREWTQLERSVCVFLFSVCRASGFDFLWGDVVSEEGSRSYGEALCDA